VQSSGDGGRRPRFTSPRRRFVSTRAARAARVGSPTSSPAVASKVHITVAP
jgi:hypothetical protein